MDQVSKKNRRRNKDRSASRAAERSLRAYERSLAAWDARQETREATASATAHEEALSHAQVHVRLPYKPLVADWGLDWCRERGFADAVDDGPGEPENSDSAVDDTGAPDIEEFEVVLDGLVDDLVDDITQGSEQGGQGDTNYLASDAATSTLTSVQVAFLLNLDQDALSSIHTDSSAAILVPTETMVPRHLFPDERDGHESMTAAWAAVLDTAAGAVGTDPSKPGVADGYAESLPEQVLAAAQTLAEWEVDPAFLHAYVSLGYLVTVDNTDFLTTEEVQAWTRLVEGFRAQHGEVYRDETYLLDLDPEMWTRIPTTLSPRFCLAMCEVYNATLAALEADRPAPPPTADVSEEPHTHLGQHEPRPD